MGYICTGWNDTFYWYYILCIILNAYGCSDLLKLTSNNFDHFEVGKWILALNIFSLLSPHLCFIIVFNGDLFVSRDDLLMS